MRVDSLSAYDIANYLSTSRSLLITKMLPVMKCNNLYVSLKHESSKSYQVTGHFLHCTVLVFLNSIQY